MRADNGWRKTPTRYRVTELAHLHRVQASSRVDPLVCAFSNNSVCGQNAREIAARQSRVTASSLIIHANVAANISLRSRVRCRYRRKSCWIDRARIGLSLSLSLSLLSRSPFLSLRMAKTLCRRWNTVISGAMREENLPEQRIVSR